MRFSKTFDLMLVKKLRPEQAKRHPHLVEYVAYCEANERDWRRSLNAQLAEAIIADQNDAGQPSRQIADIVGRWFVSDGRRLACRLWVEWATLEAFTQEPREVVSVGVPVAAE